MGPTRRAQVGGRRSTHALDDVAAIPRFVIAAVSGYALGGGCELALACDYRIASERAVFGQPEVLLGIIPGGGGTQRLPRLVGPGTAKELMITGRQVKADEALRIGLADEVVAPEALHERALALAAEVARGAVLAQAIDQSGGRRRACSRRSRRPDARAGPVHRGVPHERQPDRRRQLPRARPRQGHLHRHLIAARARTPDRRPRSERGLDHVEAGAEHAGDVEADGDPLVRVRRQPDRGEAAETLLLAPA